MPLRVSKLFLAFLLPVFGQDQAPADRQKLTARQLFYGAEETPPAKTEAKSDSKAAGQTKPKPAVKSSPKRPKPADSSAKPAVPPGPTSPASPPQPPSDIVRASYSGSPLGLRYTLTRKSGDQAMLVPADSVFHTGDHIRIGLEVNDAGYLYMINQGTSGSWNVLFPSPDIDNGDNRVVSKHTYDYKITFTGQPGTERLFVIFSREPEQDMERLIYSLRGGKPASAVQTDKPRPQPKVMLAQLSPVEDSLVERMRNVYSRDLIVEKVDQDKNEENPGESGAAVYVVNPKGSADSRVVADILLRHE
ncbi:MAG: DUF4384 domain-containing protein [Bryobacteraceae bacterium]